MAVPVLIFITNTVGYRQVVVTYEIGQFGFVDNVNYC